MPDQIRANSLIELVQSFLNFFAPWFGTATIGLTILTLIVAFTDDGEREWPGIVFLRSCGIWIIFLLSLLTSRLFLWLSGGNFPGYFANFWVPVAATVALGIAVLVLTGCSGADGSTAPGNSAFSRTGDKRSGG